MDKRDLSPVVMASNKPATSGLKFEFSAFHAPARGELHSGHLYTSEFLRTGDNVPRAPCWYFQRAQFDADRSYSLAVPRNCFSNVGADASFHSNRNVPQSLEHRSAFVFENSRISVESHIHIAVMDERFRSVQCCWYLIAHHPNPQLSPMHRAGSNFSCMRQFPAIKRQNAPIDKMSAS